MRRDAATVRVAETKLALKEVFRRHKNEGEAKWAKVLKKSEWKDVREPKPFIAPCGIRCGCRSFPSISSDLGR